MPKPVKQILHEADSIFDSSEASLQRSVADAEIIIYDELIKILNTVSISEGRLITNTAAENFLMTMDKKIYNALSKADYNNSVLKYTKNFGAIGENVKELYSTASKINITNAQIKPFLKIEVNNTIDKLTGSGMAKDFINPVRESLYRNIMLGANVSDVEKTLKDYVITNANGESKLMRYVKQVSSDAIRQFDGAIQANIGNELKLNAIRYAGSLIRDSRAQCIKWVSENSGLLKVADLEEEIRWALNNGTYRGKRASGMNPDTNVVNFVVFRGGYNCRHRAFYTKVFSA